MRIIKLVLVFTLLYGVTSNVFAYHVQSRDGNTYSGMCDNGRTFAGNRVDGIYTVSGPRGSQWARSESSAIRKACGE